MSSKNSVPGAREHGHGTERENGGEQLDLGEELTDPEPPHLDVVFGVLQNSRRRLVLKRLEEEPSTTIGDLAEHIAAIENDIPQSELRSAQRKRVYVSLYQSHLPKLDDAGAVSYDRNRGTVESAAGIDEFLTILDRSDTSERAPSVSRAFYTLGGVALLAGALAVGFLPAVTTGVDAFYYGLAVVLTVGTAVLVARGYGQ